MHRSKQLSILADYIDMRDVMDPSVSQASSYRHLDHSLRAIIGMVHELQSSQPSMYKRRFDFVRYLVLWTGWIPRGKAQAPESILHHESITQASLGALLMQARSLIDVVPTLSPQTYFTHHGFGHLNRDETDRFMSVHTRHHIKIVRDILSAST